MSAKPAAYSRSRLGQLVQRLRDAKGWTQAELAEDAGLGRGTVAHLEQGKRRVLLDHVFAVAEALSVPATLLLAGAMPPALPKLGEICLVVEYPGKDLLIPGKVVKKSREGVWLRIADWPVQRVEPRFLRRLP
jgi:transcriptional regulator with XRE-family HTH domain